MNYYLYALKTLRLYKPFYFTTAGPGNLDLKSPPRPVASPRTISTRSPPPSSSQFYLPPPLFPPSLTLTGLTHACTHTRSPFYPFAIAA